ncbi:hypothetical protein CASFOL_014801 [Castilleja foliolosa]|uniref:RING-type domain-containing protein n=1 Tax=Castilleja foliolosa TaxID=1961234 RepID=A0ABD3DCB8_9LAMI
MPARTRYLSGETSPPPSLLPLKEAPPPVFGDLSNTSAVILYAILFVLICVSCLVIVAPFSWIRRFVDGASSGSAPPAAANMGLKKKVLKSLPKQTVGEDDLADQTEKHTECAICLAEFAAGEEIRVLPQCAHSFHVGCVDTWFKSHSSCPSCRAILVVSRFKKCGSLPELSLC